MEDLMMEILKTLKEMDLELTHLKIMESIKVNLKMDFIMDKEDTNLTEIFLKDNGLMDNTNFDFLL